MSSRKTKNIPPKGTEKMKNKTMLIFFVAVLIVAMGIIIKGTMDKSKQKEQDIIHAEDVASGNSTVSDGTKTKYEFYQTNPETNLAVIYTFESNLGNDGKGSGTIIVDNAGSITRILCAVKKDGDAIAFIFAGYDSNDNDIGDFKKGDTLVKLHKKEKGIVPEWSELQSLYPGEEVIRNY